MQYGVVAQFLGDTLNPLRAEPLNLAFQDIARRKKSLMLHSVSGG